MDADGYVQVAQSILYRSTDSLEKEIDELRTEVEQLRELVNRMLNEQNKPAHYTTDLSPKAVLYQNQPNPFSTNTKIRVFIPETASTAFITIADMSGRFVRQYTVSGKGDQNLNIPAGELKSGTYAYSLFVDGKVADSKKMILID